jgi:hypothetical protein
MWKHFAATEARLPPNTPTQTIASLQTPAKHTNTNDRLSPDSRQTRIPPDPTTGVTTDSFAFLATTVATVRT